jgi:TPP-dependent pyruvate/acetoin dehydrogenase alpha subunit
VGLQGELCVNMLSEMCKIRFFEETVDDLFARGLLHGTMHLSIGQQHLAQHGTGTELELLTLLVVIVQAGHIARQ